VWAIKFLTPIFANTVDGRCCEPWLLLLFRSAHIFLCAFLSSRSCITITQYVSMPCQNNYNKCPGTEHGFYVYRTVHHLDSWIKIEQVMSLALLFHYLFSLFNHQEDKEKQKKLFILSKQIESDKKFILNLWPNNRNQ